MAYSGLVEILLRNIGISSLSFLCMIIFLVWFTQHIEDLTQEKFSLQRELEVSRTLAESLAAENSSLTDSFNQQVSLCIVFLLSMVYLFSLLH